VVSLHNDGAASPPTPVINVQTAVTRLTRARHVHGANQTIPLDVALRAQTIDAARTSRRDHLVGSISVGKLADFVELTADPYTVDPTELAEAARVTGTWVGGNRVDLDQFIAAVNSSDNSEHAHLNGKRQPCCR
jgi:predicted amidohydrolase YtcJ